MVRLPDLNEIIFLDFTLLYPFESLACFEQTSSRTGMGRSESDRRGDQNRTILSPFSGYHAVRRGGGGESDRKILRVLAKIGVDTAERRFPKDTFIPSHIKTNLESVCEFRYDLRIFFPTLRKLMQIEISSEMAEKNIASFRSELQLARASLFGRCLPTNRTFRQKH